MLTIDTNEVCNPPRDIVGYSALCAAWRFFIIANHSIDPGCGIGAGFFSRCAFAAVIAAACWRHSSKIPSPFIGVMSRSVSAQTSGVDPIRRIAKGVAVKVDRELRH